ncbi:MAG: hypothetical protein CMJ64_04910 [Planctomycetaceae bacterium]|nr:hypothetical protein [Planctomycetaceae bacterium]
MGIRFGEAAFHLFKMGVLYDGLPRPSINDLRPATGLEGHRTFKQLKGPGRSDTTVAASYGI